MPRWPNILLCVSSFDQWSRHRTEGYGSAALPTLPGHSALTVHTWRPEHNRASELRRFFIGGSPELESIDLAGIPNGHTVRLLYFSINSFHSYILTHALGIAPFQARPPHRQLGRRRAPISRRPSVP